MHPKPNLPPAAAELRRCAEERLKAEHPEMSRIRTEADTQRLVHELQVHQIELEMQNEELQQARNELEGALEKYSDLYDFAPVGYLTLDREGTICEANLTCANLLGIERARLVKRRFGLHVSAADLPAFNAFLTRVFESKARESCEVLVLKEGKPPVAVRLEGVVTASGRECRVAATDITEHKRAEGQLLILSKLESTGILAGGIAHDFNNLLTVVLLDLEMARALAPNGRELALYLDEAKQATLTAHGLTQQLITFAKGGALARQPTRLAEVVKESVQAALSGSPVRGDFSLAEDLWVVEADAGQIGQVIRGMVLNAREAMPQGGVVSVRAENVVLGRHEHPSLLPGDYVRVSISDRGGGIPKEVLPKIFDPYFSTKQRGAQKGMGLGLTICHSVVQNHGGAIVVESELGVGTTFHFHLPASRNLPGEKKAPGPKGVARPSRILVMEAGEAVRNLVGLSLQRAGHDVELAPDGHRAIEIFAKAKDEAAHPFDAVVLALAVPGGLGASDVIRALHRFDPGVKAIVMSGYSDDPVILEPERYGFKAALIKPFDADKLEETLARVLETGSGRGQ